MRLGDIMEVITCTVLTYSGTDPEMQAGVDTFNAMFGLTLQFGFIAILCVMLILVISRS